MFITVFEDVATKVPNVVELVLSISQLFVTRETFESPCNTNISLTSSYTYTLPTSPTTIYGLEKAFYIITTVCSRQKLT